MKKLLLFFCLCSVTLTKAQVEGDCEDLFFSEIYRKDTIIGGHHIGDYVIEIFNPTGSNISLQYYSLDFRQANNTVRTIGFDASAQVPAKGTFVITNTNAESSIQAISDRDTTLLDTAQYVEMKLQKFNGTTYNTIDVFGQPYNQSTAVFNLQQFISDPTTYISTYGISLEDLAYLDIRRGYFVSQGISTFNSQQVFGTWGLFSGNDQTGLDNHKCLCNMEVDDVPVVGFKITSVTLDEKTSLGNYQTDLDLQWSTNPGAIQVYLALTGGNATTGTHIEFSGQGSTASYVGYYSSSVAQNVIPALTMNNLFVGTKTKNAVISASPFSTYNVDVATGVQNITIRGNSTAGIKTNSIDNSLIYPTVTSDFINLKLNTQSGNYNIVDMVGKTISTGTFDAVHAKIDVSNLSNAMYFINFTDVSGLIGADKFVKQ